MFEIENDFVTDSHVFLNIAFPKDIRAKEIVGINIILPVGSDPALMEQIQNNPLANELGRLFCLAMGNPEGCIPLRVSLAP